ncbi:MAG TPA: hypothetical protein VNW68_01760 [Candidatus Limnocylindria bacterium]|jgi:hypothetical protein|nr:hypothetical protein [Candidatus Limnocylindria bacterium]
MNGLEERLTRLLGARARSWQRRSAAWQPKEGVPGGNDRSSVELADGRRVFVKAATSPYLAAALHREREFGLA